jgi:2-polyprenyl-3-methyl-5-hydroxy-6-metoxy-1,4-benzoquinol methylase
MEMTRPLVGTIHRDDMFDIREGVDVAQRATDYLHMNGARIEIPSPWRWWEYGTAIQLMLNHWAERVSEIELLDVGSGWSPLGPTMALTFNTQVTEYEPSRQECMDRIEVQRILHGKGRRLMHIEPIKLEQMPDTQFDVVCCVSVLEHVQQEAERQLWMELAKRVKPNGMLYITTDCVEEKGKKYTFDHMRSQNFTVADLKERVERLMAGGFTPLGKPDWEYHGAFVYDYTFFRAGMMKLS